MLLNVLALLQLKITLMNKRGIVFCLMILAINVAKAQTKKERNDTLHIRSLPDVTVVGRNSKSDYQQMQGY